MKQLLKRPLRRWFRTVADAFFRRLANDQAVLETLSDRIAKKMMLQTLLHTGPRKRPPYQLFGAVSNDLWFWLHTEGYRTSADLRAILPALPEETQQYLFTGAAGDTTLAEGFAFYQVVQRLFEQYVGDLEPSRRVLDFGCGWGRIIRFFSKDIEPNNLWGIDCYDEALTVARQTNRWAQFRLIDPRPPVELPPAGFDLIYCYSVFSHLAEDIHLQWLVEFHRLLKPGGLLVATTRPREFIQTIDAHLPTLPAWWARPARPVFADIAHELAQYDAGQFCYSGVGGGGPLNGSFFGEACIPQEYVEKHWTRWFTVRDFITDRSVCPQNIIVVQKAPVTESHDPQAVGVATRAER